MEKTLRLLLSGVMLAALLAGMQITAFSSMVSSYVEEHSIPDNEVSAAPGAARTTTEVSGVSAPDETGRLNDITGTDNAASGLNDAAADEINPISANPGTGAESIAIPAAVALLAASTAAIVLSAKKRS